MKNSGLKNNGRTPLHEACISLNLYRIKEELSKETTNPFEKDEHGHTAFYYAMEHCKNISVKFTLNPESQGFSNVTKKVEQRDKLISYKTTSEINEEYHHRDHNDDEGSLEKTERFSLTEEVINLFAKNYPNFWSKAKELEIKEIYYVENNPEPWYKPNAAQKDDHNKCAEQDAKKALIQEVFPEFYNSVIDNLGENSSSEDMSSEDC